MNDEKSKIDQFENNEPVVEEIPAVPEVPSTPPVAAPVKAEVAQDISKIKIRTILKQRIKKCGGKKIVAFILVAIISFAAGVGVDRVMTRHRMGKAFRNRPGINRQFPKERFNKKLPFNSNQQKP